MAIPPASHQELTRDSSQEDAICPVNISDREISPSPNEPSPTQRNSHLLFKTFCVSPQAKLRGYVKKGISITRKVGCQLITCKAGEALVSAKGERECHKKRVTEGKFLSVGPNGSKGTAFEGKWGKGSRRFFGSSSVERSIIELSAQCHAITGRQNLNPTPRFSQDTTSKKTMDGQKEGGRVFDRPKEVSCGSGLRGSRIPELFTSLPGWKY